MAFQVLRSVSQHFSFSDLLLGSASQLLRYAFQLLGSAFQLLRSESQISFSDQLFSFSDLLFSFSDLLLISHKPLRILSLHFLFLKLFCWNVIVHVSTINWSSLLKWSIYCALITCLIIILMRMRSGAWLVNWFVYVLKKQGMSLWLPQSGLRLDS